MTPPPPGRHPTDAEREERAMGVLVSAGLALEGADIAALARCLRHDVVWLGPDGRAEGPDEVATRMVGSAGAGARLDAPQQKGAHAVLRWAAADGARRGLAVETRDDTIVLVMQADE